ncbi:MAG: hypothetical protein L0I76_23090 [Pseudonocardia sp.]|nr:hypothetical protein [Pseudonocardia sp.]
MKAQGDRAAERRREDRALIEAGAAALRHRTNQDRYGGLSHPDAAYALASVLDALSFGLRELPDDVRAAAVAAGVELSKKRT